MTSTEPNESSQTIGFLSQLMKNVANVEVDIDDDFLIDTFGTESHNTGDQDMDVEAFNIL